MKVRLAYGRQGLEVDLPDNRTDVVEPTDLPGLPDERGAIRSAVRSPLGTPTVRRLAGAGDSVAIVVNDGTRAMPSRPVLDVLLEELAHVPRSNITVLVATGTHRANTASELVEMLGPDIARGVRMVNHDARDESAHVFVGVSARGHPIFIDRLYMGAAVKILTGFVEPHFFAGFSGGPKPVMPGLASMQTILLNHGPQMIAHPRATFGVLDGNPIHEEQREIALLTRPSFSVNVALNSRHEITGVWAGGMIEVHDAGVTFVRASSTREMGRDYDVVLTTNSGFPLDQNLYQSVKGMAAAARAVRPGGVIVLAAECADGLPSHGNYGALLAGASDPGSLLASVLEAPSPVLDGWQAQIQAQIQERASVYLFSSLPDAVVRGAMLRPCHDIGATVRASLAAGGPHARLLVLPQGPQSIVSRSNGLR